MTSPMLTCGFSLGTVFSNRTDSVVANSRGSKGECGGGGSQRVTAGERRTAVSLKPSEFQLGLPRTVYIEVLRASPVNTTGVQKPDLVGCPQNDNLLAS